MYKRAHIKCNGLTNSCVGPHSLQTAQAIIHQWVRPMRAGARPWRLVTETWLCLPYAQSSTYARSGRVQGTVPKRIGGLPCRDASMFCDDSCFPMLLSLKGTKTGQYILRPMSLVSSVCTDCGSWLLFVGCLHLLWAHLDLMWS